MVGGGVGAGVLGGRGHQLGVKFLSTAWWQRSRKMVVIKIFDDSMFSIILETIFACFLVALFLI